jgi:hypothetical protein
MKFTVARLAAAICVAALPASPAAAGGLKVELAPDGGARLDGRAGLHAVDRRSDAALVRIVSPGSAFGKRGTIRVLVMNLGTRPFAFGPAQVSLQLGDGTKLAKVPVSTFQNGYDLVERESRRAGTVDARIKSGLAGLAQSSSGGMPAANLSGQQPSGDGGALDGAAAGSLDRGTEASRLPGAALLDAIGSVLQADTVSPKAASGGYLLFEVPRHLRSAKADQPLTIIVTTGGETHRFSAMLRRT